MKVATGVFVLTVTIEDGTVKITCPCGHPNEHKIDPAKLGAQVVIKCGECSTELAEMSGLDLDTKARFDVSQVRAHRDFGPRQRTKRLKRKVRR